MMTFSKFDVTKDNTSSIITRNKIIKPLIILLLYLNFTSNLVIAQLFEGSECELYDGSIGVCKSFAECKTAIADLNRGAIRYSQIQATRCSFSGSTEIICCGDDKHTGMRKTSKRPVISNEDLDDVQFFDNDEDFYNNYADRENHRTSSITDATGSDVSTNPTNRIGDRKSEIACANYTSLVVPALSYHILGGKETQQGEFPHMAAIGFTSEDGGDDSLAFNCGGSIINEEYILTAAHCVNGRGLMPTLVRMGQINLLANSSFEPFVDRTITKITSHPNYSPSKKYDDIALIRVSPPIAFDENIRPACLRTNTDDIDPGTPLIVTGWGSTSIERNQRSNILLKTNLTAVSIDQCNSSLLEYNPNNRALRSGIVLGQICAKDPTGTNDACQGDSGGPLQTVTEDGLSTIVGITSFGISCGSALPSVYSRVAYYIEWIESIAWSSV